MTQALHGEDASTCSTCAGPARSVNRTKVFTVFIVHVYAAKHSKGKTGSNTWIPCSLYSWKKNWYVCTFLMVLDFWHITFLLRQLTLQKNWHMDILPLASIPYFGISSGMHHRKLKTLLKKQWHHNIQYSPQQIVFLLKCLNISMKQNHRIAYMD